MSQLGLNAEIRTNKGSVKTHLSTYLFQENDIFIVYCPALDISGYGATKEDAKHDFSQSLGIFFSYCLNKKTLVEDLRKHGWNVKSVHQKRVKSPSIEQMMKSNDLFKDILNKKEYSKFDQEIELPQLV